MFEPLQTALLAAEAADAKKAFDIQVLDLRGMTSIADAFVICSGGSTTQVGAVADGIADALARAGVHASHLEGVDASTWVLMDYGDVVVHIFEEQTRIFYGLDRLWGDAPRLAVPVGPQPVAAVHP